MFPPIFQVAAEDPGARDALWWPDAPTSIGGPHLRLYPFGEAPEGVILPYAVWQVASGSPENYINQRPDMDNFTLQIDVYAATGASARAVGEALRDSIELRAHITRWGGESKDEATGRYRLSFDVDWLTPR